jgi:hypothetical protein
LQQNETLFSASVFDKESVCPEPVLANAQYLSESGINSKSRQAFDQKVAFQKGICTVLGTSRTPRLAP